MSLLDLVEQKYGGGGRTDIAAITDASPPMSVMSVPTIGKELQANSVVSVDQWSKRLQSTPEALEREAGDDWDKVSNDPAQLVAFADSLAIVQIRESGAVPNHYTATTECSHCGPVPIFEGLPAKVFGCPWCFNRIKGLPIPTHHSGADDER